MTNTDRRTWSDYADGLLRAAIGLLAIVLKNIQDRLRGIR